MDVPSAVYVDCPDCGEETLHSVLKGSVGTRKGMTLNATVQCENCSRVHHVLVKEAKPMTIPVVISAGNNSRKATAELLADEILQVEDELIVAGVNTIITGIETKDGRRVPKATTDKVLTLWVKEFEQIPVKFTINLGKKTISKRIDMGPDDVVRVGQEFVFGRLRVTVHGIKVEGRMLHRGDAAAREISRVFAKPTRLELQGRLFESAREGARSARQQRYAQRDAPTEAPTDEEVFDALPDWEEDEAGDDDDSEPFEDVVETGRPNRGRGSGKGKR